MLWALWGATGCRVDPAPELAVAWEITVSRTRPADSSISLLLRDGSGQPVRGARITVEGNMSHPGMAPIVTSAEEQDAGRYATRMAMTMAGDWVLFATITLPDGRVVQRQRQLPGVSIQ
jgi:hypothetical protein